MKTIRKNAALVGIGRDKINIIDIIRDKLPHYTKIIAIDKGSISGNANIKIIIESNLNEAEGDAIKKSVISANIIVITATVKDDLCRNIINTIAECGKSNGAYIVAILSTPFDLKNSGQEETLKQTVMHIKEITDTCIVINNDKYIKMKQYSGILPRIATRIDNDILNGIIHTFDTISKTSALNEMCYEDYKRLFSELKL